MERSLYVAQREIYRLYLDNAQLARLATSIEKMCRLCGTSPYYSLRYGIRHRLPIIIAIPGYPAQTAWCRVRFIRIWQDCCHTRTALYGYFESAARPWTYFDMTHDREGMWQLGLLRSRNEL